VNTKIITTASVLLLSPLLGYWLAPPQLSLILTIMLVFGIAYAVSATVMLVFVSELDSTQQYRLSWGVMMLSMAAILTVHGFFDLLGLRTGASPDTLVIALVLGLVLWVVGLVIASRVLKLSVLHTFSRLLTTIIVSAVLSRVAMHYAGELQMFIAFGGV